MHLKIYLNKDNELLNDDENIIINSKHENIKIYIPNELIQKMVSYINKPKNILDDKDIFIKY